MERITPIKRQSSRIKSYSSAPGSCLSRWSSVAHCARLIKKPGSSRASFIMKKQEQLFRIEDIIEKDGIRWEVTHTDASANGRKYYRFKKQNARNALGMTTHEAAIDVTESMTGYAKKVEGADKNHYRMSFRGAKLIERKRNQTPLY